MAILLANALAFFIVSMVALAARAETFITLLTPEPMCDPRLCGITNIDPNKDYVITRDTDGVMARCAEGCRVA